MDDYAPALLSLHEDYPMKKTSSIHAATHRAILKA